MIANEDCAARTDPASETTLSRAKGDPFISVIIPAHNEERFIGPTLEALRRQTYPRFEVIVAANGCRDRTREVAEPLCDKFLWLEKRGLGPARNQGARHASGDLLLFLDADTLLEPEALSIIAAQMTRRHSVGTLMGLPDSKKLSYKSIYVAKNFLHFTHLHFGSSGTIFCWRDYFEKAGGFDDALYLRENSDLMKKLRRFGKYKYIHATPSVTSMRRYESKGTGEMMKLWLKVWFLSNFSDIKNKTYDVFQPESPSHPVPTPGTSRLATKASGALH